MSKKTHAEHVADIKRVNPNVEILEEITSVNKKVKCRCLVCSHEWSVKPYNLKSGYGCPECKKRKIGDALRLTHDEQVAAINKVNPNVEILGEIKSSHAKVLCRCLVCGHKWNVTPDSLKQGHGCPACAGKGKLSHEAHAAAIKKINPNIEILEEIIKAAKKVLTRCKICGHEWRTTPQCLKRGQGCPACAGNKKLSHKEQIKAVAKVNPNIEVLGEIKNSRTKVLCRCKVCRHEWNARPCTLKSGHGCPECYRIKLSVIRSKSHEYHLKEITTANKNVEVLEKIKKGHTPVLCRCKICGHEWEARPYNLKMGKGCPRCAKYGFHSHDIGKLYIMVDDLNVPTMMKIGVSVNEGYRSKKVLKSAHKAGVSIPALHVAKTWEGPTELMTRIEQMMHKNYAEWNIKFPAKFDGCTEFFYYTPETANVFDVINDFYYTVVNQF